jgi:hypothetical protein
VFHEITVGATCTKCATYKEQATEFFAEASALNTVAAIFDLKKRILNIFRWRVWRKVTDYCLVRLFGMWGEGKVVEIIFSWVGFHG